MIEYNGRTIIGVAVGVQFPRIVGYYRMGNSSHGHMFGLTRKPGRIERFFVRRCLGLTWFDSTSPSRFVADAGTGGRSMDCGDHLGTLEPGQRAV